MGVSMATRRTLLRERWLRKHLRSENEVSHRNQQQNR